MSDLPKAKTNGGSERFGDTMLAFGLRRFVYSAYQDERPLWRFQISRGCNAEPIFDFDAKAADLLKMRAWIDRALETIATDGGRKEKSDAQS